MKITIGITLLILVVSIFVYFLFYSSGIIYPSSTGLITSENQMKIYSIREIDSLSAEMNYSFTIKNAVTHLNRDSLKTPFKPEKPSI